MRIALVSPKWNRLVNSYPPLGIGYLAAIAESEGHTVAIFDLGLAPDTPLEDDVARIVAYAPDLVGMTAMTNNYHSAQQTFALLKAQQAAPLLVGGPHATLFPERVLGDPNVDYLIYGEGEEPFRQLLRTMAWEGVRPDEASLRGIAGLCFKTTAGPEPDGLVRNDPAPLLHDLDTLPMPARHLFELGRYPLYAPNGERMVTLLTSRGCPFGCSYCFKGIMGRKYRQHSPDYVLREVHTLVDEYHYRHLYFIDDLFTFDQQRLHEICERIVADKLDIRWQCLARVDTVSREGLALMYRAGCREIHYGIESGNAEVLKRIDKRITHEQVRAAIDWTNAAGITAKGYFMLGLPGDTEETMQQTIALACELDLDLAMFSLTTPFPGTRLWDELVARQPDVEFNADFTQAFYYCNYDSLMKPFFNLSEVSDERLGELGSEAQSRFQEAKRRRKYLHALGPRLGGAAYALSNVRWLRDLGRRLLKGGRLRKVKGVGALGQDVARESVDEQWK